MDGFIIDLSTATVSSLRPFSSIIGATCATPSRVSTPRMLRTGAKSPGMSRATEMASRVRTTARFDWEVMGIDDMMPQKAPGGRFVRPRQLRK